MFKRIKIKLSKILLDKRDTWSGKSISHTQQVEAVTQSQDTELPQNPCPILHPQTIQGMRNELIESEIVEEILSKNSERVHIIKGSTDIVSSQEKRSFTEDGLVTHTDDNFVHTSEGRFIKGKELHGGGQCYFCEGYTDRIEFCFRCRRAICFKDSIPYKDFKVCPNCLRVLRFNEDTWDEEEEKKLK